MTLELSNRRAAYLLEGSESGVGSLSGLLKGVEQRRDGLVNGASSDDLLGDVEGLGSSSANSGIRVDKGAANNVDDGALVSLERRLGGVGHDLGESEADSLALATLGRGHGLLENGDDLSKDSLSELARGVGESPGGGL